MSLRITIQSPNGGSYTVTFDAPEVRVGRASFCALRLPYQVVSSHHLTITGSAGDWWVTDVGSTNGSWIDGSRLPVDEPRAVTDGLAIDIGEVRIEFAIVRDYVEGFTLAESGTLLRKLVSESARASAGPSEDAFFEVLEGPRLGTRYPIPDDTDDAWAGDSADSDLRIIGIGERAFRIGRDGDGFRIRAGAASLSVNDASVPDDGHVLRSADHVLVGAVRFVWFDPLEPYLDEIGRDEVGTDASPPAPVTEPPSEREPQSEPDEAAPLAADNDANGPVTPPRRAGLSVLEWVVIVGCLAIAAAAIYAIAIIATA